MRGRENRGATQMQKKYCFKDSFNFPKVIYHRRCCLPGRSIFKSGVFFFFRCCRGAFSNVRTRCLNEKIILHYVFECFAVTSVLAGVRSYEYLHI